MGPPLYMRSVVDQNVVMWPTAAFTKIFVFCFLLKMDVHHTFLAFYGYCILYYWYFIHLCNQISFAIKTHSAVCDGCSPR